MRLLLFLLLFLTAPAHGKALPPGEYAAIGDVFPAIRESGMVPVLAHVTIAEDRLTWRFFTAFDADADTCARIGKCEAVVTGLIQRVRWEEDGTLTLLDHTRVAGDGLTVDRPEVDDVHIYDALATLIDGAALSAEGAGLSLTRSARRAARREVTLVPASVQDMREAAALVKMFNLSLAHTDHCVLRQVLRFKADPDPSAAEAEVLAAARYAGWINEMDRIASYWPPDETPAADAARIEATRWRLRAAQIAMSWPGRDAAQARLDGAPLDDDMLLAKSRDGLDRIAGAVGDDYAALRDEILGDRRDALLAAIRLSARFTVSIELGLDPGASVCQDITLGGQATGALP